MQNFTDYLAANTYPGRGVYLGKSPCGKKARIAYFIMGRSVNSANRVFVQEGCGIRTKAFDESKLTDPSLVIYAPVRVFGDTTIVTNGDQTGTIYDAMRSGGDFISALRTRTFEPDGPNFTPRISGSVRVANGEAFYTLSILKAGDAQGSFCARYFYEYERCAPGDGLFIHTYMGDGDPLPSFVGEPRHLRNAGDLDAFTANVWQALHEENKVSLFTRQIDLASGEVETRIVNKNK